ncbi:MAG: hypothetical protein V1870_03265, partial [Candidatus Aenigmatarchaeota archaeon]
MRGNLAAGAAVSVGIVLIVSALMVTSSTIGNIEFNPQEAYDIDVSNLTNNFSEEISVAMAETSSNIEDIVPLEIPFSEQKPVKKPVLYGGGGSSSSGGSGGGSGGGGSSGVIIPVVMPVMIPDNS